MGRVRKQWSSLSGEAKLGIVVMPIILALLAGVVSPLVVKWLSPDDPAPERRGVVKILDVEPNVPLSDFSAQHAAARLQPQDYVLASVAEELPAAEQQSAPSDSGDLGEGDSGASGDPGDGDDPGDGGEPGGDGSTGDPGDGDDPGPDRRRSGDKRRSR